MALNISSATDVKEPAKLTRVLPEQREADEAIVYGMEQTKAGKTTVINLKGEDGKVSQSARQMKVRLFHAAKRADVTVKSWDNGGTEPTIVYFTVKPNAAKPEAAPDTAPEAKVPATAGTK